MAAKPRPADSVARRLIKAADDLLRYEKKSSAPSYQDDSELFGVAGGIRTRDLLVRSQTLYPAELQPHAAQATGDSIHQIAGRVKGIFDS